MRSKLLLKISYPTNSGASSPRQSPQNLLTVPRSITIDLMPIPGLCNMSTTARNMDRFSSGLDEKGKKEEVPLRSAYSQAGRCGMQPKAIFARRRS
ncbi:hypothetical protein TNCV_2866151 [Trichonephila clavipes]|nr:hypothetical protein TNCV_2866151 [Trichonephila clavipes]